MSESYRNRTIGWTAGAALVAAVVGVTGCSNDTDSAAEKKPTASSSTADGAKETQKERASDDPAASQPSGTRQTTAEGAVAAWVTAVIENRPKQACLVMAEPATGSSPARVGTPSLCNGNTPEARKMRDGIGRFHASFTPKRSTGDPKVEVARAPVTGGRAVVPAEKVTVDGQTLDKVILSNSTGLKSGQLDVKMESTKIGGAWYVTNLDFNVG
ncbi:hypothetical protein ABZ654_36125 [Streptomyces hygroscopicus]|uniref:hypothetical protein n=1 Tax=Streptomyces TaxID=1883 RepID=UPI0007C82B04|nr:MULTISPECIES: hypothetical protein [Streptomyces]MDN3059030.1 hypothetical protein [Streptomyces sp. SRF1]